MKKIVLLLAALAAAPAFAQNVYVTGSVGQARQKVTIDDFGSDHDSDTGATVAVGYRVTPNFAIEGGYASFGKVGYDDGTDALSFKSDAFYGAIVGTYPVSAAVSLSAKVGVSRGTTKVTADLGSYGVNGSSKEHKTSALFGIGAAYNITPALAIVTEYQYFGKTMDVNGLNVKASIVTVGARYAF